MLFTSIRGGARSDPGNPAASGSDIYRYDLASREVRQLTRTPESEYSGTVIPDGGHFSIVRVEADGTQRLWQFAMDGTGPSLLLPDIKPVGYHAWLDARTLALFVLGAPPSLQLADTRPEPPTVIARDIGRSIQRMPDGRVSVVTRHAAASRGAAGAVGRGVRLEDAPADETRRPAGRHGRGGHRLDARRPRSWYRAPTAATAGVRAVPGSSRCQIGRRWACMASRRLAVNRSGTLIALVAQAAIAPGECDLQVG